MNDKLINYKKLENYSLREYDIKIIRNKKFFKTQSISFYDNNNIFIGEYDMIEDTLKIENKIINININVKVKEFTVISIYFMYKNQMFDFELCYNGNTITSANFKNNHSEKNFNFIKMNNFNNCSKSNKNIQILENNKELFKIYKHSTNHFRIMYDLYEPFISAENIIIYIILISMIFKKNIISKKDIDLMV